MVGDKIAVDKDIHGYIGVPVHFNKYKVSTNLEKILFCKQGGCNKLSHVSERASRARAMI